MKRAENAADFGLLASKLRKMKLSAMADKLDEQCANPNIDLVPASSRIEELVNAEWDIRYNKKLSRYFSAARLRYPDASLDDSLYDPERKIDADVITALSTCDWVAEGRNILVTGYAGTGKTYIVNALCVSAIRKFMTVRYGKAMDLIYEIQKADLENRHEQMVKETKKIDVLVIDDFGLMELSADKTRGLFEIIDAREGVKSTVVIAQLPVSSWYSLFGDNTYADAIMDRLVHRAYRIELNGKNMRNPQLNKTKQGKRGQGD